MTGKDLLKENAARAVTTTPNVITGCAAMVASAALLNPLPAILWGLGSTAWVLSAIKSGYYNKKIIDEERRARTAKTAEERAVMYRNISAALLGRPFLGWVRNGSLPDYVGQYRRLEESRDRIAHIARERSEVGQEAEWGIVGKLDQMLTAYLRLVNSRVQYIQILTGQHTPNLTKEKARPIERMSPWRRIAGVFINLPSPKYAADPYEIEVAATPARRRRDSHSTLSLNTTIEGTQAEIARVHQLIEKQPATREIRESHVALLEKRLSLLQECRRRDQRVTAQLESFADAYELILGQMRATQFDAGEVVHYMDSLAGDVADTESFVQSMQPMADHLFAGDGLGG